MLLTDQPADDGPVFYDLAVPLVSDGALDTCRLKRNPLPDGEPLEAVEYAMESNWVFDSTNRAKRFTVYLFYAKCFTLMVATTGFVYLAKIRRRFPNPVGGPCVGYKPPPNLNRNVVLMC